MNKRFPFYPIAGYSAPMSPRILAGSSALLIALAAPAAAQALPTIQPLKPCYVTADTAQGPQSEGFQITAAGFTPNSTVDLTIDGQPFEGSAGLQTDAAGGLVLPNLLPAPFVAAGSRTFTVTLTEVRTTPPTPSRRPRRAPRSASRSSPASARPSQRIRFRGLGFTEDKAIYAHYIHKGKVRKTVRMARQPRRDCGGFSARRRQIPIKNPGLGKWILQFDQYEAVRQPGRDADRLRPARDHDQAGTALGARENVSSPSAASTRTRSPATKSPCNSPSARRSTRCFWITRLSGRAPYVGS